ncbi:MAG: cytochrome-c peroxidase [Chitinophagaceae bacterium]
MTKQIKYIAIIVLCSGLFIGWVNISKPTKKKFTYPKHWPKPHYNFKENPLTEEGIALGKKLFYDPHLAADSATSCASCHQQFAAFSTYDHPLSHGINNQFTKRNAPALQQLAWQKVFHADGGINHLDVQFLSPLTNSNEMGADLKKVINYLQNNDDYKQLFRKAFGSEEVTTQKLGKAFSQFLLTLVSSNSKYDRVKQGLDSFILPEKLGYAIFQQKCANCHPEPFFNDFWFHNIWMPNDK